MSRTATQPRGKTAANAKVEPMPASSTITIERSKLADELGSAAREEIELGRFSPQARA